MSAAARVIDMWAPIVPSREILAHVSENFPDAMLGYIRVFFKRDPDPESVRTLFRNAEQDDASMSVTVLQSALATGVGPDTTPSVTVTAIVEPIVAVISVTSPVSLSEANLNTATNEL